MPESGDTILYWQYLISKNLQQELSFIFHQSLSPNILTPPPTKKRAFRAIVFWGLFCLFIFIGGRHHKCARYLETKGLNTVAYALPSLLNR